MLLPRELAPRELLEVPLRDPDPRLLPLDPEARIPPLVSAAPLIPPEVPADPAERRPPVVVLPKELPTPLVPLEGPERPEEALIPPGVLVPLLREEDAPDEPEAREPEPRVPELRALPLREALPDVLPLLLEAFRAPVILVAELPMPSSF